VVAFHDHALAGIIVGSYLGNQGSLLLFVLILSGVGVSLAAFLPSSLLRARALVIQGLLTVLFLVFLWMTSNPFNALPFALPEGQSLNPLLQDRGLLVHPPLLYVGYVGFSAPFSLALAALWGQEDGKAWAALARPWVLFAWGALTAGVTLGSWWAYYELGWGGWWFWDPVENVSLMPWLAGTALLHTLLTGKLYRWSLLLSLLTFGLSLFGTFLVRSGLMTSVHSFADDPERGLFILSLIGGIMGSAFFMWAWRAPRLQSASLSLLSREGALLLNSLLLMVGLATLLLGTLYPLWSEGTLSIGAPYFELTFIPLSLPLFLLIPLGGMLRDKREPLGPLLMAPLTATLGGVT
jgi:cytochrome c-type biogenesis protein CcmF